MVAAASDGVWCGVAADVLLEDALRTPPVIESAAGHWCVGGTHSRMADDRVVCWSPPQQATETYAVDAEIADQPVPAHLGHRWQGEARAHRSFWSAWCASEVCAKLLDIPIVVLAARGPVSVSPVLLDGRVVTYVERRQGDIVMVFGVMTT